MSRHPFLPRNPRTPARTAPSDTDLARRRWLAGSGAALLAAATGSAAWLLPARQARAADYRALVCVFLYGGNDGNNTVVPVDATRHAQYRRARGVLALPQSSLLTLDATGFALHPSMAALMPHWTAGQLAPVFNVGPLAMPLTKAQYRAEPDNSPRLPESLFSHSHQQTLWEAATSTAIARTGWGGRAVDVLQTTNPVISVGNNGLFGVAAQQGPLVVPGPGSDFGTYELGAEPWRQLDARAQARAAALRSLHADSDSHVLTDALMRKQRAAFEVTERLGSTVSASPAQTTAAISDAFAPLVSGGKLSTAIAQQLFQVAKLIAQRAVVRGDRQIFFAEQGGYDTHGGQIATQGPTLGRHAELLKDLADALAAFQRAMNNLALANQVTAFTQSDFGRTLAPNDSLGSDHAWGNHQLVLGGAVKGRATYGRFPELELGGPDDVGQDSWELQGRWIPTTSVDQYAATLLRWFGADEGQLDRVFPNLAAFGTQRNVGFI